MSKKRYFEETEPKFKAGVISDTLRSALNIGGAQLPNWIYRMRVLGYPPGWLKNAEFNTLSVIDDSESTSYLSGNAEDGEIMGVQYNRESFIEYPGFNVELSPRVNDDWHMLGMPPMLPQQQLKEALKVMKTSSPVPYKKIKLDCINSPKVNKSDTSFGSLNEFYATKEDSDSDCVNNLNNKNVENAISLNLTDKRLNLDSDKSEITSENNSESDFDNSTLNNSNSNSKLSTRKLKLLSMGSPMPVASNPIRPSLEKWSIGMGELIYFENLPNYTGMYQNKMKSVIKKIRNINNSK